MLAPPTAPVHPTPLLTRLSDIPLRPVRWLWPGRIPLGKLTLLMGEPGMGKSLIALDIAARLSKGIPWPDANASPLANKHTPLPSVTASVLLLTSADDPGDTIRPRLEAAGAILHKIRILDAARVTSGAPVPPPAAPGSVPAPRINGLTDQRINDSRDQRINDPLAVLGEFLTATPDCRLVVIDPLEAFLDGCGAGSPDTSRALLAGLTALAEQHNVAILLITHANRRGLGAAQPRSIRSLGLLANVRIAWTIVKDDADPSGTTRHLLALKNNLGHDNLGLSFHINDDPRRWGIPKVDWDPDPVFMRADAHDRSGYDSGGAPSEPGASATGHTDTASIQTGFNHRDHREHRVPSEASDSRLRASGLRSSRSTAHSSLSVSSVHSVVNTDSASKPGPEAAGIALASAWLRDALSRGPMTAREVFAQAHAALAVCAKTLRRAAAALPITIRRDQQANQWMWTWDAEAEVGYHPSGLSLRVEDWPGAESLERPTSAPALSGVEGSGPRSGCSEHQTSNIATSNMAVEAERRSDEAIERRSPEPETRNSEPETPTPARAQSANILSILSMWLKSSGLRRVARADGTCPSGSPNLAALLAGMAMMLGLYRRHVSVASGGTA